MSQRSVFLVTGLPATGKSTLARALAQALAAPLLAKDAIKEPLLDVLGATDPAASRALSDASFAVLFALANAQLAWMDRVVLEGNFRPGEHERAVTALLAHDASLSCTQILCRVPEGLRQARLQGRGADAARHRGHRDADWVSQNAVRGDDFLDVPGPRFIHDGGVPVADSGCELIRSLTQRHLV